MKPPDAAFVFTDRPPAGVARPGVRLSHVLRAATWLLLGCWLAGAPAFHLAAQSSRRAKAVCAEAGDIARQLTVISGLPLRRPVPCDFITKDKVNEFLKERVKEAVKPGEIRAEELTLKKFGFVPPDFDLAKTTVELLTEQAAAFYDYDRHKLFITETTSEASQEPVLAHELSHALADQSFHLSKYIKKAQDTDDGSAARLAVMEGQATWLMSEYVARKTGQSLRTSPELANMSSVADNNKGEFPIFDKAPLYLRISLVFPYTKGILFQNALAQRDGEGAFAEPFRHPPVSTQQILHPEKYFASVKPTEPALPRPNPRLLRGYKPLVGGTLGELDQEILIEQFAGKSEAAEIAPHWRGSAFELRENRKAGRVVLLYAVEWDSEESARRYFVFYKEALAAKWKHMAVRSGTTDAVEGTGDDGRFELRRNGAIVTSVEGLDPEIN